ncbi:MAG: hypothetical protein JXM70_22390, partial [Pirellulales bacterium]|nr:hypothetical protein [Pirellulales bacterium]
MQHLTINVFSVIYVATSMLLFSANILATEAEYAESFDSSTGALPRGWQPVCGKFSVENGALQTNASKGFSYISFGKPSWQNYEIEVTATFVEVDNSSRWLAIVFRAAPDGNTPRSQYTLRYKCNKSNGAEFAVYSKADPESKPSWSIRRKTKVEQNCILGKARKLKVRVVGSRVDAYLDGRIVLGSPSCFDR